MAIDVHSLWNFGDPAGSEIRFQEALASANGDDRWILQTQIARSHGIQKDFQLARAILATVLPHLETSGAEVAVRYWLELGRTYCSTTHPKETQTEESRSVAREAYTRAFEVAKAARLDELAIDVLHMMTLVDPAPEDQIRWNQVALDYLEASDQAEAKGWEGSLRNNLGYALHLAGRYEEALVEFEKSRLARISAGKAEGERVARWMIAWTLRTMGRTEEALQMQLQLEQDCAAAGADDPYVFEELETLYRSLGQEAKAEEYKAKRQ